MTEVAFHFNVPDRLGYACRLLRKAHASGARVAVTGPADELQRLDQALWTFAPLEFVPHCRHDAPEPMRAMTPVVLVEAPAQSPHQQVLLHLGQGVPEGFERFERLIEIVSAADDDRAAARQRWRHYAGRGYAITRHDVAAG